MKVIPGKTKTRKRLGSSADRMCASSPFYMVGCVLPTEFHEYRHIVKPRRPAVCVLSSVLYILPKAFCFSSEKKKKHCCIAQMVAFFVSACKAHCHKAYLSVMRPVFPFACVLALLALTDVAPYTVEMMRHAVSSAADVLLSQKKRYTDYVQLQE